MVEFLCIVGEVFTVLCLLYCSWYYLRQGGVNKTIIGILVLLVVGLIPAGPIIFAVYLFTKKKRNDPAADVGEPKVYHG